MSSNYDPSPIGDARRLAIHALDDYGCTIAEQRAMFGITESTFHRYADGVRARRRPSRVFYPGCTYEPEYDRRKPREPVMPPADALEIATIALIKSEKFTVDQIVKALRKTSKSAVYRQRDAYYKRLGNLSPVENHWHGRHLPSHLTDHLSPPERAREAARHHRQWVSRPRRQTG